MTELSFFGKLSLSWIWVCFSFNRALYLTLKIKKDPEISKALNFTCTYTLLLCWKSDIHPKKSYFVSSALESNIVTQASRADRLFLTEGKRCITGGNEGETFQHGNCWLQNGTDILSEKEGDSWWRISCGQCPKTMASIVFGRSGEFIYLRLFIYLFKY